MRNKNKYFEYEDILVKERYHWYYDSTSINCTLYTISTRTGRIKKFNVSWMFSNEMIKHLTINFKAYYREKVMEDFKRGLYRKHVKVLRAPDRDLILNTGFQL